MWNPSVKLFCSQHLFLMQFINLSFHVFSPAEIFTFVFFLWQYIFRVFLLPADRIVQIVRKIKEQYPDCALTLSIGEKSEESYRAYREAGADRYLLRHETADPRHYMRLHPLEMSGENRKSCLRILKKLGYQTGAGFMVGSPLQTVDDLVEDFLFLKELDPEMVGIVPRAVVAGSSTFGSIRRNNAR